MVEEARGVNQMITAKIPERSHHSQHGKGYWLPKIGEPGRMVGCDFCREATDWEMRSIMSVSADASLVFGKYFVVPMHLFLFLL